ncbi:AMP-binding protein [Providencia sp. PROV130]|uniref:AMP-binding protein n=1 Tax=Providencia sp. PROV130 TaxID=2949840 RepID=UPI002348FC08|nr:AMP-binding protein [Providencia sp. PROV130]
MAMQPILKQRLARRYQKLKLLNALWDTTFTLLLTMLVSSMAVLINISVISQNTPQALYALGLFLPLNYVMMAIHEGLRIPTLRYSSQHHNNAYNVLGSRLALIFCAMVVLMALLVGCVWLFQSSIAALFHIAEEHQQDIMSFILPMLLAGIPIGCATLILSILFSCGLNRSASMLGISGTALNLAVTWLAATYWHQGLQSLIWGALIGSSYLAFSGGTLLYSHGIRLSLTNVRREAVLVLNDIAIIGSPVAGSFLLLFGFLFSFNYLVSFYGANEIAGFGIAFRIQSFVILPAIALGTAMAIHANNAIADQNFYRIRHIFFTGIGLAVALYLLISVLVFLLQEHLVALFTLDETVIVPALRYLNCIAPSYLSLGVVLVLMTTREQTGQGQRVLLVNIVFYAMEIGIAALLGLNYIDATRLYLVMAIMNWVSALYVVYELNKHLAPIPAYLAGNTTLNRDEGSSYLLINQELYMMNSLSELIRDASTNYPTRTALIFKDRHYSYHDIWMRVCAIAAGMRQNGLQPSERIVICLGNHPDSIAVFWAAQKLGACPSLVPIDTSVNKLAYILNNSGAKQLFTSPAISSALMKFGLQQVPKLSSVIVAGETSRPKNGISLEDFIADPLTEINIPLAAISVDLASIIYTSGSTGEPKGVMLSHQNMLAATDSLVTYLGYRQDDVIIAVLPVAFDYGLYQLILSCYVGATVVLEPDDALPTQILRHIQQYGCTVLPGLSSLYSLLDTYASRGKFDLSHVRLVSNTGMALRKQHINTIKRLFPQADIFSMYGLTECKRCTWLPPADLERKPDSVGIAIPNTQILVVNDQNQPCVPGEVGQLVIRGATVMQGYWRNPEATAKKIGRHPLYGDRCLYSGDYGWLDDEGYFYFAGRMDEVAKIRGRKVIFSEVEKALFRHEAVIEAAVIAHNDEQDPEDRIVAFVATSSPCLLAEAELRQFCLTQLEQYQVPHIFVQLSRLPKNANGKYDKHKLLSDFKNTTRRLPS